MQSDAIAEGGLSIKSAASSRRLDQSGTCKLSAASLTFKF